MVRRLERDFGAKHTLTLYEQIHLKTGRPTTYIQASELYGYFKALLTETTALTPEGDALFIFYIL